MISLSNKYFFGRALERTGTALVVVSVLLLLITFAPVLQEELKYQILPPQKAKEVISAAEMSARNLTPDQVLVPKSEEFGIVIPKIGANALIIPGVDWQDSSAYQQALTQGVAQAKGTKNPGETGNVFLFAHSGTDLLQANRYNAIFYLIDKLQFGDEIVVFFHKEKFIYHVTEKKTVKPEQLEYLTGDTNQKTITLMTCFPAGTTYERLLVIATQDEKF